MSAEAHNAPKTSATNCGSVPMDLPYDQASHSTNWLVVWFWALLFSKRPEDLFQAPKLHGILVMALSYCFFSNISGAFFGEALFHCIWHLPLTPKGKGVQDLLWLQLCTLGRVHTLLDVKGLQVCKHLTGEVILSHQDLSMKDSIDQPGHMSCVDTEPCRKTAGRLAQQGMEHVLKSSDLQQTYNFHQENKTHSCHLVCIQNVITYIPAMQVGKITSPPFWNG